MTVNQNMTVSNDLTGSLTRRCEAQPIDQIVQAKLKHLHQVIARDAHLLVSFSEVVAELLLKHTICTADLLFLTQLQTVGRNLPTEVLSVLAGREDYSQ